MMLGRFAVRGFSVLSPYVQKQRHTVNFVPVFRLLSQTPTFNVSIQKDDKDSDLLFDLGGTSNPDNKTKSKNANKSKTKTKPDGNVRKGKSEPRLANKKNVKTEKKEKLPKIKKDRSFEQLKYHDIGLNLTYVKLPFQHPGLENLMLMLKSRKYRNQKNLLLIEGRRLTLEAIEAGLKLKYVFFSHLKQIETIRDHIEPAFMKDTEILRVPHNDLTYWSTLTTCPGLITVFEKPTDMQEIWDNVVRNKLIKLKSNKQQQSVEQTTEWSELNEMLDSDLFDPVPITVICDQVREPNNLGGIIRTCASIPCTKIILLKGCADPWDIKALRGGCGAQFRIEIVGPVEWEDLPQLLPKTDEVSVFIADNRVQEDSTTLPFDESDQKRKEKMVKYIKPKVYSDIPFSNCKHIALVIGGETEGVSSHALDFMKFVTSHTKSTTATAAAAETEETTSTEASTNTVENDITNETNPENIRPDNAVVKIPLGNGVESLNASVATAILLFEMRKQLIK
ncbi:rRNA methyltransferase 3, mitochondrial [Contarinia nasturtii]|uniref:rRNA methyltransferase 3, mitochondrial n=1 Tax=Contarinia nasturtii TaxID=265458 RepID=UPI0012D3989E|nr:rRNA methyltransferase 3, mitochondrial [Contarinia nasturtii]